MLTIVYMDINLLNRIKVKEISLVNYIYIKER